MHHRGTNSRPRIRHGAHDIHTTIIPSSHRPNIPSASLLACLLLAWQTILTKEHRLTEEEEDEEQQQVLQRRSPATGSKSMTQEAGDDPFAPFSPSLLVPRPAGPTIKAIKAQEKALMSHLTSVSQQQMHRYKLLAILFAEFIPDFPKELKTAYLRHILCHQIIT